MLYRFPGAPGVFEGEPECVERRPVGLADDGRTLLNVSCPFWATLPRLECSVSSAYLSYRRNFEPDGLGEEQARWLRG